MNGLRGLKARGLTGVKLVIADAHLGLRAAVNAILLGASVQRCRVHYADLRVMPMWSRILLGGRGSGLVMSA